MYVSDVIGGRAVYLTFTAPLLAYSVFTWCESGIFLFVWGDGHFSSSYTIALN